MPDLWYDAVFVLACLFLIAVPIVWWVERRAEDKDREIWAKQPGSTE